jgi:hypothetical protein
MRTERGKKTVELRELNRAFFEKTPITIATRNGDGTVQEQSLTVYHNSWFDVLPKLAEIENTKDSDVPQVTRQLLTLDAQVKEFTHEGKPVVMDAEKWAVAGLPVQDAIARELWRAKFGDFKPSEMPAEERPGKTKRKRKDEGSK